MPETRGKARIFKAFRFLREGRGGGHRTDLEDAMNENVRPHSTSGGGLDGLGERSVPIHEASREEFNCPSLQQVSTPSSFT